MKLSNKYFWIARRLHTEQLQKISDVEFTLSESDMYNLNIGNRGIRLFLGFYSEEGLKLALHKYSVYKRLQKKGFKNVIMTMDTSDPYKHRLLFYDGAKHHDKIICELVVRKQYFKVHLPFSYDVEQRNYVALAIDWLCMQDIYAKFSIKKPRLPGQQHPGLGLTSLLIELLMIVCWRLNLAALINVPEHYHNAFLYSKIFMYLDPDIQAKFLVIKEIFKHFPLEKISWGIEGGCVIDNNTDEPFTWKVSQQILPLDKELKKIFPSKKYNQYVRQAMERYSFSFDEEKYNNFKRNLTKENMEKCI